MNFEYAFLNFIYGIHNPLLDNVMVFITHLGDGGILWIVLGLIMCFFKKYRRAGYTVLLALLIMLLVGNLSIKPLVARLRPYEHMENITLLIPAPSDFSFPSGHTFASFAAAMSVFIFHKKEGMAAIILACLIAFSRLYLYVHFPSDILAGIVLGIVTAYISRVIILKFKSLAP